MKALAVLVGAGIERACDELAYALHPDAALVEKERLAREARRRADDAEALLQAEKDRLGR